VTRSRRPALWRSDPERSTMSAAMLLRLITPSQALGYGLTTRFEEGRRRLLNAGQWRSKDWKLEGLSSSPILSSLFFSLFSSSFSSVFLSFSLDFNGVLGN
jgi:hypothetical protein